MKDQSFFKTTFSETSPLYFHVIEPLTKDQAYFKTIFFKTSPLYFHVIEPLTKDQPFFKTTFSETSLFCFSVIEPLTKDHPFFKTTFSESSPSFSSVQFHPFTDWVIRRIWGTIQQTSYSSLFCRKPFWALLAEVGMSTLWCCPSSISSADQGVTHPPRCPEGWFWRGCRDM